MSREIKYRVWGKTEKEYIRYPFAWLSIFDAPNGLEIEENEDLIIEQYTGLKDKNGKEIYEGDIMRFDAIDYEIYWSSDFSGWHNRRTDKGERIYGSNSFEEVTRFGSVIGNIHENPELIGGEE